ncbi:hypothetical protein ALO95_200371 [Pseudomonas syringae pv. antirrhini]|nr:hypothetical protein ALQ23_200349 [Pseudomonas syringae pv. antirrhini]RMW25665.1 hypothetical protein ALO95_200371 [Pseudomonas syringae pv. antirrhini]
MTPSWPPGLAMAVNCPNCRCSIQVDITVARDHDCPSRPVDCDECSGEFELLSDGSTQLMFVPPRKSTRQGRDMLVTPIAYDPKILD